MTNMQIPDYTPETLASPQAIIDALGVGARELDKAIAKLAAQKKSITTERERVVRNVAGGSGIPMRELRRLHRTMRRVAKNVPDLDDDICAPFFVEAACEFQTGDRFEMPDGDIWEGGKLISTMAQRHAFDGEGAAVIHDRLCAIDWTHEPSSPDERALRLQALAVVEATVAHQGFGGSGLLEAIGVVRNDGAGLNRHINADAPHLAPDARACWQRVCVLENLADAAAHAARSRETGITIASAVAKSLPASVAAFA